MNRVHMAPARLLLCVAGLLACSGSKSTPKDSASTAAAGKTFTRASFLKTLTSTTFSQTPSLTPLRYTPTNHQGLNGGYLTKIASATSTAALDGKIYTTDSSTSGPVVAAKKLSSGMPSWLK